MKDYMIKLFYNYDPYEPSRYAVRTEIEDEEELITKFLNKIIDDLEGAEDLEIDFSNKKFKFKYLGSEERYSWDTMDLEFIEV